MLVEAPNRLHWVRVRDALAELDGWTRVSITHPDGKQVVAGTPDGDQTALVCARLERFPELIADTMPHEDGGFVAFWSRPGRMIAIPEASSCLPGCLTVAITASVVIIEEGRNFELVASDSSWRMRPFDARKPRPEPVDEPPRRRAYR